MGVYFWETSGRWIPWFWDLHPEKYRVFCPNLLYQHTLKMLVLRRDGSSIPKVKWLVLQTVITETMDKSHHLSDTMTQGQAWRRTFSLIKMIFKFWKKFISFTMVYCLRWKLDTLFFFTILLGGVWGKDGVTQLKTPLLFLPGRTWHGIFHWARVNQIYAVLRKIRQLDKYWGKIKINTCVKF